MASIYWSNFPMGIGWNCVRDAYNTGDHFLQFVVSGRFPSGQHALGGMELPSSEGRKAKPRELALSECLKPTRHEQDISIPNSQYFSINLPRFSPSVLERYRNLASDRLEQWMEPKLNAWMHSPGTKRPCFQSKRPHRSWPSIPALFY